MKNTYSDYNHFYVFNRLRELNVKKVLDMGGKGRSHNRGCSVIDANIKNGIDGSNLPFNDDEFDAAISIATLEHVGNHEKQKKFIREAIRVSKIISIHWIPVHSPVESFLKKLGHRHPCIIPNCNLILEEINITGKIIPFTTIKEHLIFLSVVYPRLNVSKLHQYILNFGKEIYAIILEIEKD